MEFTKELIDGWAASKDYAKLVKALGSTNEDHVKWATQCFVALGADAIAPLCDALKSDVPYERRHGALALAKVKQAAKNDQAVEALIAGLNDPDPYPRCAISQALGKLKDVRAVAPLCTSLREDGAVDVRRYSAEGLGRLKSLDALDALTHAVQHDANSFVRVDAIVALGKIKSPQASAVLCRVLYSEVDWKTYPGDRKAAAKSLSRQDDEEATTALEAFAVDSYQPTRP